MCKQPPSGQGQVVCFHTIKAQQDGAMRKGRLKTREWKTRELKSQHHNAGVENERNQYGKPHFDDIRRALHERKFFSMLYTESILSMNMHLNVMCVWPVTYRKITDSTDYVLIHPHSRRNTSVNKNMHMSVCSLVRQL